MIGDATSCNDDTEANPTKNSREPTCESVGVSTCRDFAGVLMLELLMEVVPPVRRTVTVC